jgi:hypothetical protein
MVDFTAKVYLNISNKDECIQKAASCIHTPAFGKNLVNLL